MNFLAHIYLSFDEPQLLLGNFMADMLKGRREVEQQPLLIQKGVQLHYAIDAFTDSHLEVKRSKDRLRGKYRHYAAVIVDIFYDHLLAKHWKKYNDSPLPVFSQRTYAHFQQHFDKIPPRVQPYVQSMINHDWLLNYAEEAGIRHTFWRTSQRTRFPSRLEEAPDDLFAQEKEFTRDFHRFFPELQAFALEKMKLLLK